MLHLDETREARPRALSALDAIGVIWMFRLGALRLDHEPAAITTTVVPLLKPFGGLGEGVLAIQKHVVWLKKFSTAQRVTGQAP